MSGVLQLRPLTVGDAEAVHDLASTAFAELDRASGVPPSPGPPPPRALALPRFTHPIETDPGGCWGVDRDGELVGAAQAIDRDGIWGLSLLVVRPDIQSQGLGRALLERTLAYADGGRRGAIILSSQDPRALRRYARAGFTLHPSLEADGPVLRAPEMPPDVVRGGPADAALVDTIGVELRGAGHGRDVAAFFASGAALLLVPDRGFAFHRNGDIRALAARDEAAAADLLRAVLAESQHAGVSWITSAQPWAVPVVLEAGLSLGFGGAVALRGELGRFTPYLPSGAYL